MSDNYLSVHICRQAVDVDLYTGALSEKPMEGAIIGPLLSCLITDQFLRIKKGDSHWYERPIGPQRFSKGYALQDFIGCSVRSLFFFLHRY